MVTTTTDFDDDDVPSADRSFVPPEDARIRIDAQVAMEEFKFRHLSSVPEKLQYHFRQMGGCIVAYKRMGRKDSYDDDDEILDGIGFRRYGRGIIISYKNWKVPILFSMWQDVVEMIMKGGGNHVKCFSLVMPCKRQGPQHAAPCCRMKDYIEAVMLPEEKEKEPIQIITQIPSVAQIEATKNLYHTELVTHIDKEDRNCVAALFATLVLQNNDIPPSMRVIPHPSNYIIQVYKFTETIGLGTVMSYMQCSEAFGNRINLERSGVWYHRERYNRFLFFNIVKASPNRIARIRTQVDISDNTSEDPNFSVSVT